MVLENLLIINEDKSARTMLRYLLEIEGYIVKEAGQVEDACLALEREKTDMILLDASWEQAVIEGFLGKASSGVSGNKPHMILVIPEKASLEKMASCKQLPVSHQIQRPFSPRELISMIRRCINNPVTRGSNSDLSSIDVQFDDSLMTVTIDGVMIKLAKIEYDLLRHFLFYPNKIFSRKDLLHAVWGKGRDIEERTVDVHIRRLRRALKNCDLDKQVQTVHGAGYRFAEALVAA